MSALDAILAITSPSARREAVGAVGAPPASRAEVRAFVFAMLGDEDSGVRHETVKLAQRWRGADGLLEGLNRAIRDESLARRSSAVEVLGQLGESGFEVLGELVTDENDGLRRLAVDALGMTKHALAAPLLEPTLSDESAAVRSAAVEALCRVDAAKAEAAVRQLLERTDETPGVLLSVLLAVDAMELDVGVELLRPHVKNALTAVPTLKLLGRFGDLATLVDTIRSGRGSRLRAALAGFGVAAQAEPERARKLVKGADIPIAPLEKVIQAFDLAAVRGALALGAILGRADWFVAVARRSDRASLLAGAHSAATLLPEDVEAATFLSLADDAVDPPESAFLSEIGVGMAAQRGEEKVKPSRAMTLGSEAPRLDNSTFLRLVKLFHRVAGLVFEPHSVYRVESRLLPRVIGSGVGAFASYVDLLESGSEVGRNELDRALHLVTVHETYLFREPNQLSAFSEEVIDPLVEFCGKHRRFRVLSAGCSSGEEAWTLAMLLEDSGAASRYEVKGIDISESVIATARAGRYPTRGIRDDNFPAWRERYLSESDGYYEVADALRANVSFDRANLNDPIDMESLGRFHAIFCRNVIIYLSRKARAELIARFYEQLEPGGVLFLGHSESLINLDTQFRFLPLSREMVYVKPGPDGALWRPSKKEGQ